VHVTIAGAGLLGTELARALTEARHDVTVVDLDERRCEEVYADLGVMAINGSGTSIRTLEQAGIQDADVAVGTMSQDADNLAFTLLAQRYGVPSRIVRMRDQRYLEAYRLAGATYVLGIVRLGLQELLPAIESPDARRVAETGGGAAEMVSLRVAPGAPVVGRTVAEIVSHANFPGPTAMAAIVTPDGELVIPTGSSTINQGDEVLAVARVGDVPRLVDWFTAGRRRSRRST